MKKRTMKKSVALSLFVLTLALARGALAQVGATGTHPEGAGQDIFAAFHTQVWPWSSYKDFALDKVYADESHCLRLQEIRSEKDNAASCYCRDAIAEGRYVYFTYLLPGKDDNLNGMFLNLEWVSTEVCGENFDVYKAASAEDWKWTGPEVVRTYPPDDVIRQIKPDSRGVVPVEYTVVLIHRDSEGHVTKTESFSEVDRLNADALKRGLNLHMNAPLVRRGQSVEKDWKLPNPEPQLPMPPKLHLPRMARNVPWGDPQGVAGPPSNGPGTGGSIGPGEGGGVGGGVYSLGGGVSAPTCVYCLDPPYSEEARKAKVSGTVTVQIIVDAAGSVRDARVVSAPLGHGLDEKAIEAISTWRFKPSLKNGVPVNVRMLVKVDFRLF